MNIEGGERKREDEPRRQVWKESKERERDYEERGKEEKCRTADS